MGCRVAHRNRPRRHAHHGFTLVELVVVITLSAALSIVVMQFVTAPVEAYVDQSRRATLVDEAQLAVQRITNDVRQALPNSIRVGCGGACVEFLRAVSGGRYRAAPPGDALSLLPADADTGFEVLGALNHTASLVTSSTPGACAAGSATCLVIYNTGFTGTNAWAGDNIATLSGFSLTPPGLTFLNSEFSSGLTAFPAASPGQRFFLVDTPVSFLCDSSNGELRRYQGYTRMATQSAVDTHAELTGLANPAEHALLATRLGTCRFHYTAGTPTRNGVLTVSLSITESGESVTLLQQVHVDNQP